MNRFAILLSVVLLMSSACRKDQAPVISLTSVSPDNTLRSEIREKGGQGFDRRFFVDVYSVTNNKPFTMFESPDENVPGSERILWSSNSLYFLITGNLSCCIDAYVNKSCLYLLYSVRSNAVYCNSSQVLLYPRFSTNDIATFAPDLLRAFNEAGLRERR